MLPRKLLRRASHHHLRVRERRTQGVSEGLRAVTPFPGASFPGRAGSEGDEQVMIFKEESR